MVADNNDFRTKVNDFVNKHGVVRREFLVTSLVESNKGQLGYSKASVEKRITKLLDPIEEFLKKLDSKEVGEWGIRNSDKRAAFITLIHSSEIRKHIGEVIKFLKSGKESELIDRKAALKELEIYKKQYVLSPSQLDMLVQNLTIQDDELTDTLLRIIKEHIFNKGIRPLKEELFITHLKNLLSRYQVPSSGSILTIREKIIILLGFYNDKMVVEQLIRDFINHETVSNYKNAYWHKTTAKIIEESRKELFDLERKLRMNGKEGQARELGEIRFRAMQLLGLADDSF